MNGWLLLDKSEGISSANALNIIKRLFKLSGYPPIKIGHAGTLDPFASGLLVVAIGEATKLISYVMQNNKSYEFSIKWGENRDTLDREGRITKTLEYIPKKEDIEGILHTFVGRIMQQPPEFSALNINGQRAYHLARRGEEVKLSPRLVEVYELYLKQHDEGNAISEFYVSCGKGFYVRSLARDIASTLNACGYVLNLRRVKNKKFHVSDTISLDKIKNIVHNDDRINLAKSLQDYIKPINCVLDDILVHDLSEAEAKKLKNGLSLLTEKKFQENDEVAAFFEERLIAICVFQQGSLKPKRVFNL